MTDGISERGAVDPRIDRTRRTVFMSALTLASEKGFAATTMNEIAAHSGVSKSTIYRHWDGVTELFLDALKTAASQTHVPPDTGNLRDDLVINLVNYSRALTETPYGAQTAHLASAAIADARFAAVQRQYNDQKRRTDRPMFERALTRRELPASTDIDALQELLAAPLPFRLLVSRGPLNAQWVSQHVDHVLKLAGYQPPTQPGRVAT